MKFGPKSSLRPFLHRALQLMKSDFSCQLTFIFTVDTLK